MVKDVRLVENFARFGGGGSLGGSRFEKTSPHFVLAPVGLEVEPTGRVWAGENF